MSILPRLRAASVRLRARRAAWLDRNQERYDRQEPWWDLWLLVLLLYGLMAIPPVALLAIIRLGRTEGQGDAAVLFLSWPLIGAVIVMMAVLICIAAMQGGYARMVTDRLNRRWSMLLVAVLATGFVVTMQQLHGWLMKGVDITRGDQVWIAAFVTVWLLVIVYVCKVPLDRARDLWARHYEARRKAERERRLAKRATRAMPDDASPPQPSSPDEDSRRDG